MSIKSDRTNLIRKISFRKGINYLKLRISFLYSRFTKKNIHKGLPVSISIEPTTACNLGCPECPSGLKKFSRPTGNLKQEMNKKIIDELERNLLYINFYFQGEPYINPDFLDMVSYASQKKIYTSTSTNAHFINEENARRTVESGLDRLIISIDGTTQETYSAYRVHGKLEKVLEGTRNIIRFKKELKSKTPHVIFQFLVVKPNEHQIEDVLQMAKDLEVDEVRLKTAQVYDYKNGNPLIPTNEKYARYKKLPNGKFVLKNRMEDHCWRMWSSCVITWDGAVVPCCFDKDASFKLGKMEEKAFADIWKSEAYNQFRKNVLTDRKSIDICSNCSEGTKVWA
jgi:radical SAM protein with 4Fe4S-binding SPASM domain